MLDFMHEATYQDALGTTWTYYLDDVDPNTFYIVPLPQYVIDPGTKQPQLTLVQYETDDNSNGSGTCQLTVELSVPQSVLDTVTSTITSVFPQCAKPRYQAMQANAGAAATLTYGAKSVRALASAYGGNVATFDLSLSPTEMKAFIGALSAPSTGYQVDYQIAVPASLQAFSAVLSFNSATAFSYQVTQPTYNSWGDETSPGYVTEQLHQSNASTVAITWGIQDHSKYDATVATWANNTLATLVQSAVREAVALQNLQSSQSFSINEVASFTNTYSQNQVIAWNVVPQAVLPGLGAVAVQALLQTVKTQKQTMTVVAQLPFLADLAAPNAPPVPNGEATILSVDVQVSYPGLSQTDGQYSFKKGESKTFICDYNDAQGPTWSITYVVNFQGGGEPVTGTATVTEGTFTLQPLQAGIRVVTFDATTAFKGRSNVPDQILVDLMFMATGPGAQPFTQPLTLTKDKPSGTITSVVTYPINVAYNYTLTYTIGTNQFTPATVQNQTASYQEISGLIGTNPVNVMLAWNTSMFTAPVTGASAKLWYSPALTLPAGGNAPTEDQPVVYDFDPSAAGSSSWMIDSELFQGSAALNSALFYSAEIDALSGQILIDQQPLDTNITSIVVSPTQRYFTIQVDPTGIDWTKAASVQINIQQLDGQSGNVKSTAPTLTWMKNDSSRQFVTFPYTLTDPNGDAPQQSYRWTATYVVAGGGSTTTTPQTSTAPVLDIPSSAEPALV